MSHWRTFGSPSRCCWMDPSGAVASGDGRILWEWGWKGNCHDTAGLRKIPMGHFSAWRPHTGLWLPVWIPPVLPVHPHIQEQMEARRGAGAAPAASRLQECRPTGAIPGALEELSPWGHPWSLSPPSHRPPSSPPTPRPPALPIPMENQARLPSQRLPFGKPSRPEPSCGICSGAFLLFFLPGTALLNLAHPTARLLLWDPLSTAPSKLPTFSKEWSTFGPSL